MTDEDIQRKIKVLAFYLPQFHPIPENDAWWGKGFTEWTNVRKAVPRFAGHCQPKIPANLGYYDLRDEHTRKAQAELAQHYGISGFCYYHYWFNGKMLLEHPFNEVLHSGKPDFPFCLCWANESWSKRWDGSERDLLIEQNYSTYDCDQHIAWLGKAFEDKRYIRINDKPLFLLYNASHIPNLSEIIEKWRIAAHKLGIGDIYICAVLSQFNYLSDLNSFDFNAYSEFHPNPQSQGKPKIGNLCKYLIPRLFNATLRQLKRPPSNMLTVTKEYSYRDLVTFAIKNASNQTNVFPCVAPNWDNSARKRVNSIVLQNNDPKLYGQWLSNAIARVQKRPVNERIVFINAWNEWAEGCYLEPDQKFGTSFLEETKKAIHSRMDKEEWDS